MINTSVVVEDRQVVKLILEFLDSRKLHNTMRSLEKEAGIVNCSLSDDILFLRDLVLDGEWEAILIFAQPFEGIDGFDSKRFRYIVLKQKFMEVLYFKSGFGGNSTSYSIEDLIKCLNQLEEDCPNKSDYSKLCWLLSVPNLPEQPEYRDWSPATARLKCFEQLLDLLKRVIPIEKKGLNGKIPKTIPPIKDRLLHLLIKGLCFESCVDYCQLRAINGVLSEDIRVYTGDHILHGPSQESSGNFLSWLQNLSQEAFITPFEPANLEVDSKKVKQASGVFHKSPRRDDAEILSRSLSLSGRPATADIASHLAALEKGKNANAILNNRPHSAQPAKEVSHSYNEFQYKSGSKREPSSKVVSNGFNEYATIIDQENKERLSAQVHILDNNLPNIDQDHHYTPVGENNYATELSKEQQQQNVLKQLEAHEKQKLELERQLKELSFRGINHGKADGEELGQDDLQDERPMSMKSLKNLKSENVSHGGDSQGTPVQTFHAENGEDSVQNHNILEKEKINFVEDTPVSGHLSKYRNPNSFSVNQVMTSTPARRIKTKPDDLNLEENKFNMTASDVIPVTPAEQTFPVTPLTNGPVALSAGHWVALADGSGVLNTSTPKSTRHGLSSTPAPEASPVLSVDGATPRGIPFDYESVASKVVRNYNTSAEQPLSDIQPDLIKDKENLSSSVHQQVPLKRGPKVNGVRRSLVPQTGAKHKATSFDESKQMRTPGQHLDKNSQASSCPNGETLPGTPQRQTSQQQMGQVHRGVGQEGYKANGQPSSSARTFVVGPTGLGMQPSDVKPPNSEGYIGETQTSDSKINSDVPKGKEPRVIDMTYRKPSTNTPPNNTTVTVNHAPFLEKHKELSSDTNFYTVATLEDVQAIRAIAFHPSGDLFAIGSNSKALRVCSAEGLTSMQRIERQDNNQPPQPTILFKSNRHHRGSIYCVAWSAAGDIIATGSNDKSIKMTRFDAETCSVTWPGLELAIHNGTVRDLAFVSRASGTPVLVSGGAGGQY